MEAKRRILRGEPIKVGDREIVPEVELTWVAQRRATFGLKGSEGDAWAMVRMEPVGLVERSSLRTRRIPIHDQTWSLLWGLLAGALAVPLLTEWAARLARPRRET
jgi:hypothetical protein